MNGQFQRDVLISHNKGDKPRVRSLREQFTR
jgi:hypothetical protein